MMLTVMNDITERKNAEDRLRENEEKYHRLIDLLPVGVIIHQNGNIVLINPSGLKLLGVSNPEELIGGSFLERVHPDYREIVSKRIQDSLTKGRPSLQIEEKLLRMDGTIIDVEAAGLPFNYGDSASTLVVIADITERKQAEDKIRKSEENFRNLSENTVDGILIGAPDGSHIYANHNACELLQYSPEEILRTSQEDISDPEIYPFLKKRLQDRLAGKNVPKRYETSLRHKDGTCFPVEISGTRTIWGDKICDLVVFRDITERRQAQEAIALQNQRIQDVSRRLVEVQEMEKHMLASELHDDLGQSLTSLKLILELINSAHSSASRQEKMTEARELVSDLMGKVRNLSLDLRPAMLDDFGLFAALRWLFDRFQSQTGITIHCNDDLTSQLRFEPLIETAAFRIIQEALTNVARHAKVQEVQVCISVGDILAFEIVDQGAGFVVVEVTKNSTGSGGLSGMQERARLLGGNVEFSSAPGTGTRVGAVIPLTGGTK